MSKERLEEIERHAEHRSIMPMYPMHDRPIKNTTSIRTKDYDWLIKQAERAEESERQMFTMVENTEKLKSMLNFKIKLLEKQNKRYRDVIEIAIHNMKGCSDLGTVFALNELERVLEGEE